MPKAKKEEHACLTKNVWTWGKRVKEISKHLEKLLYKDTPLGKLETGSSANE